MSKQGRHSVTHHVYCVSGAHVCRVCGKGYANQKSLYNHEKFDCGKEARFACTQESCLYKTKRKADLLRHLKALHRLKVI